MKTPVETLTRVRNAIYGQPWAITPEWLDGICEIFERHASHADRLHFDFEAKQSIGGGQGRLIGRGQYAIENGVAVIPLMGPIFPRANMMTQLSGATSMQMFVSMFQDALKNPDVNSILIQIDSPGGAVTGLFEAASEVFNARRQGKAIIALAEGTAASAAYAVGSQAMEFFATEASLIGSIGVIGGIVSTDRAEKNAGIDSRIISTGHIKETGSGPISEQQVEARKKIINEYFSRFKDSVMRARSGVNIDEVATGDIWVGQKAVDLGLVDGISTMDEQLARLAN